MRVSIHDNPPPPHGTKVFIDDIEQRFVVAADDVDGWADVHDPSWPYGAVRRFGVVRIEIPGAAKAEKQTDYMDAVRAMCR